MGPIHIRLSINVDSPVYSVAFSPSDDTMAVGLDDGKVLLVDVATVAVKRSLIAVKRSRISDG
jgi:WD40 repeat protein